MNKKGRKLPTVLVRFSIEGPRLAVWHESSDQGQDGVRDNEAPERIRGLFPFPTTPDGVRINNGVSDKKA